MRLRRKIHAVGFAAFAALGSYAAAVEVQESWVDRLDGPASMNDYGQAVAVGADGSAYVAGLSFHQVGPGYFAPRFVTVKYDTVGTRLWEHTYAGTLGSGAAAAQHVAVDGSGDILVSGSTNQGDDWAVLKYDPAGNELWQRVYEANSTFLTEPSDMAVDTADNVYLVGDVGDGLNPTSGNVVKYSSAGDQQWVQPYYGPTFEGASLRAVASDDLGNVYAAGSAYVPGQASELCIVKFNSAGVEQWLATDGSIGQFVHDRATEIAVDANGDIVAVGVFGSNSAAGLDIVVTKYDDAGNQLWREIYAGPAGRDDAPTQLAIDSDDNIIVVGYSGVDFDDSDALTLKYDPSGTLLWEQRVSGAEVHFDWATSVTLDAQDNIYVVGGYDPIGGERYFTVRYDPSGQEQWFMDYAGPMGGGSRANAVAVAADGAVYVTGESPDAATDFDIATIRYEQISAGLPGDINGDGAVDVQDLLILFSEWGPCPGCASDLNGDGSVDVQDLLELFANWS